MTPPNEHDLAALLADRSWLERLALRLVKDPAAADDLVQDTMVRAWRGVPGEAAKDPARRRGWLRLVLRRLAIQRHRSEGRRSAREREVAPFEDGDASALERAQMRRDLVDEVLRLPEPERTAVTHRYLEERSYTEIAALHGLSEPAARKRVSRGIAKLRERLDERHGGRKEWAVPLVSMGHFSASTGAAAAAQGTAATKNTGAWWLTMKTSTKLASAFLVAMGVGTLAWVFSQPAPGDQVGRPQAAKSELRAEAGTKLAQIDPGAESSRVDAPLARDRVPEAPASAPASSPAFPERPKSSTGTLSLTVQWHDGAPAAGIAVKVTPYGDRRGGLRARRYRTDAKGCLALAGLSAGRVATSIDRCDSTSFTVDAGAVTEGHLTIPEGFSVEGTVTGPGGTPVPGAEVLLSEYGNNGGAKVVAVADANGRYTIRDMESGRSISARAAGFSPSLFDRLGEHPQGATRPFDIALRPGGGRLYGTVRDAAGTPIHGALVHVAPPRVLEGRYRRSRHAIEDWTDEKGRFDFTACGSGNLSLTVRTEMHEPFKATIAVEAGDESEVQVIMKSGGTLRGRIARADGSPANFGSVTMRPQHGQVPRGLTVRSGPAGSFQLHGIPKGTFDVYVSEHDQGKVKTVVTMGDGESKRLDFTLEVGRTLTGTVLDERDAPLAGWMVGTTVSPGGWDRHTNSRTDGSFTLSDVREDATELDVTTPGGWLVGTVIRVPISDGPITVRVPDDLRPSASLGLRVLVAGRAPDPPAQATWSYDHEGGWNSAFTDANGEAVIKGLRPGPGVLTITAEGLATARRTAILEPGKLHDAGTIKLGPGGFVRVEMRGAPGIEPKALPGQIMLMSEDGRTVSRFELSGGTGESEALEPGRYQISTGWSMLIDDLRYVDVQSSAPTTYQITVRPTPTVKLQVDSPAPGILRRGYRVEVRQPGGSLVRREQGKSQQSSPDQVSIRGLAPGRYTIHILAAQGLSGEVDCDVPPVDPKPPRGEFVHVKARVELIRVGEPPTRD